MAPGVLDISISEDLDELRTDIEGCRLAAFADISARMVLRVSAEPRPRQEEIDALCELASRCLDSPKLTGFFDGEAPFTAMVSGQEETRFFVRSLVDPSDALILIVNEPVKQIEIWKAAQNLLDRQASGADEV